jgi:hypothetical protein
MLSLLHEDSPRSWTWAYAEHRLRAYVCTQAGWHAPGCVGLLLAGCNGAALANTGLANSVPFMLAAVVASAVAGYSGSRAVWHLLEARLLSSLDAHPQAQAGIRAGYRLPPRPNLSAPFVVLGESHPDRVYVQDGSYQLNYTTQEQYSSVPEWCVLSADSLVTGLLVLGAIGSGKTAYVLRPGVFHLFDHPSRPGGLVMDSKAALVEPLAAALAEAGRAGDLLPIGPSQPTKWNPFHAPAVSASTLADFCLTVIENVNGAPYGSDSRWIRNGAAHLLEGVIGLVRLRFGYVTALSIREFFQLLLTVTAGADDPGATVSKHVEALFAGIAIPNEEAEQFQHFSGLLVSRMSEDQKFRTIYISELLQVLVPLTSPGVSETFNAAETDLDMPSWPDVIRRGLVVVLDCNAKAVPALAVVLGMMLKLGYQQTMMSRVQLARDNICDNERHMALVVDEYQEYASPGDPEYAAVCRESKSITVFATQGFASIEARIGKERAQVLVQSLRNLLVLTQSLPEWAARALGEREVMEAERSVQETAADAQLVATGRFAGQASIAESQTLRLQRKFAVTPEALAALTTGQGILQSFDGRRAVPIHRVYCRPYFAMNTRAADHFSAQKAT